MRRKIVIITLGAVLTVVGSLLLARYYDLEQWCAINRTACPNFASYFSLGTFSVVSGIIILVPALIAQLYPKRSLFLKEM